MMFAIYLQLPNAETEFIGFWETRTIPADTFGIGGFASVQLVIGPVPVAVQMRRIK